MSAANGSTRLSAKILQKFEQGYNIYRLYDIAYKHYRKNVQGIQQKYANLFSYIHLMNTRSVQQEKQERFIRDWRRMVEGRERVDFLARMQELIKLLEIIEEKSKQVRLFIQFLKDITGNGWEKLEREMGESLARFRGKIEAIFRSIANKDSGKMNNELKNRLKVIIDSTVDQRRVRTEQAEEKGKENMFQTVNYREVEHHRKNITQNGSYKVSSMKLYVKQKPEAVKLLTKEQVETLRKEIAERLKSSTITAEASVKGSENAASFKIKSQNYNTYHTEISEDSEECSHEDKNMDNNILEKKIGKISLPRHHRSNFEDASKLKKFLDTKDQPKYNSIHKISAKVSRNMDDFPSRYTIQDSSINRFVSSDIQSNIDSSAKKSRVGKISIMGKLDRTIKKIQVKNLKRPRGGMYFPSQKLKEINEIYKDMKLEDSSNEGRSSRSDKTSRGSNRSNFEEGENREREGEKLSALDNRRISEFVESYAQKEQSKYKRRFGVSAKKLNSNKSIDWSTQQAKNGGQKSKDVSRTSFFRSSGSNFQDKRSLPKSKYNSDSVKKVKLNKSQIHFYEQREEKDYEEMARKWALNRKSNQKLVTDQNIFNIDKRLVVSGLEKLKALNDIHDQEKLDRSSKYQEYYDEILRRKYEGGTREWNRDDYDQAPTFFKIDNYIDQKKVPKPSKTQNLLFDFMLHNIKTVQQLQLTQIGVETADE